MHHRTPCTDGADDRARRLMHHRTPCNHSADDRADTRCTPCSWSAQDRVNIRCTPCTWTTQDRVNTHCTHCTWSAHNRVNIRCTHCKESADDRARIFQPHRTPCMYSAHDRARRLIPHRTPCTTLYDRADKRCGPCNRSSSVRTSTSPRARVPRLREGASHPRYSRPRFPCRPRDAPSRCRPRRAAADRGGVA